MAIFTTSDIHEAVRLATEFGKAKRYDLFRGQRKDWPLRSSLARLSEEDALKATERIKLFFSWIDSYPELKHLSNRQDQDIVDQKFAVAQHYGFSTNFCDFTTDPSVAGYFASSHTALEQGQKSVIICCNSNEFTEWCRTRPEKPRAQVLRISVPNLWRLESQRGVFLFLPYTDPESVYRFDRIEFPAGRYTGVDSENVYPDRRSTLELFLDQYFRYEAQHESAAALMADASNYCISGMPDASRMMEECLTQGDPGPHRSWVAARKRWPSYRHDPWVPSSEAVQIVTAVDLQGSAQGARDAMVDKIRSLLSTSPIARSGPRSLLGNDMQYQGVIYRLKLLWDGLRQLPYSDNDVAISMGNASFLSVSLIDSFKKQVDSPSWRHIAAQLLKDPVMVEFGRVPSGVAAGFVDGRDLLLALRPGFSKLLKREYRHLADRGSTVLQCVQVPSRAFEFEKFASLFATQVVPTQVMLFRSKAHYFDPLQLDAFGLP